MLKPSTDFMITDTTIFAELLTAANETKMGRSMGQWPPAVCRVWQEAEPVEAAVEQPH
jgi:hypothetical protein